MRIVCCRQVGFWALLSASVIAQGCPQGNVLLAVTPSVAGMIAVSVTGTPGAAAMLFMGPNAGQTTLMGGPLTGTVICLAAPFNAVQLGPIPPSGVKTMQLPAPPSPPSGTLRFEAVTMAMSGPGTPPVIDTSNVVILGSTPPPPPQCTPGMVQLAIAPATVAAGSPVTATVTGAPGAGVILFMSPSMGPTVLPGPGPAMGTVICLGQPLNPMLLGPIPPSGTKTMQIPTPPGAPPGSSLHYQAVTILPGQPAPTVDTSNVASVTFSSPPPPPPCMPGAAVLTILPDVPVQPGNTVSVSVTAAAGSFIMMARSHNLGSTPLPFLTNPLCLAMPIDADFFGIIPASGTLTQTHNVPPNAILPGNVTIHFQAVAISPSGGALVFDTSNTDFLML